MVDIESISNNKEFYALRHIIPEDRPLPIGYTDYTSIRDYESSMLQLQGHQIFINNLFAPHSNYKRLLLYHGTGTGKTLIIHILAHSYIRYFKRMRQQPQVTIIGFTESIMVKELMKYPEFGYITTSEQQELERLKGSTIESDKLRRRGLKSTIRRNITDRGRGGFYKFFGYQKFASDIIEITPKGSAAGLTINSLYDDEHMFTEKVNKAIKEGKANVNRSLIESLKYGFIACDEIHNVYNSKNKNNRGIAIQYMLNLMELEDPASAPRVIYASATPLTGSPMEIVDLMNLLIPGSNFKRDEFFSKKHEGSTSIHVLRPGMLDRISKLCAGYVSFLKENSKSYPRRIIDGESIPGIEYLRFIKCPMSKLHADTLNVVRKDTKDPDTMLTSGAYALYDMVFPNPNDPNIGLYNSTSILSTISNASSTWKEKIGIYVEGDVATGSYLRQENIGTYSTKYKTILTNVIDMLNNREPGKILTYHYYVVTSGGMLIKEMFLENGFLDDTAAPLRSTRCSICGIINKDHNKEDHSFKPVRILLLHGESNESEKILSQFNSVENTLGHEYRMLIGTRVIHEGIDFKEIRYLYILSLPRDISTLVQLFGRAVRRDSHIRLPIEYRTVIIRILISTYENNDPSPDTIQYKRKIESYLRIQEIEQAMRSYSIDNFINYDKMKHVDKASIDGLPYTPANSYATNKEADVAVTTFTAYEYANVEVETITTLIKRLMVIRPIWTVDDLWDEIRNPPGKLKTVYDHSTFDRGNFIIAIDALITGMYIDLLDESSATNQSHNPYITAGGEYRRIVFAEPYLILTAVDSLGVPIIDYDQFMRMNVIELVTDVSITENAGIIIREKNLSRKLSTFEQLYKNDLFASVIEFDDAFHYEILSMFVEKQTDIPASIKQLKSIYIDLGAFVYIENLISDDIASVHNIIDRKGMIGYLTKSNVMLYNGKKWITVQLGMVKTKNRAENSIIVGYTKSDGNNQTFKMRPPINKASIIKDKRKISRGAVCTTYTSSAKASIVKKLDITLKRKDDICKNIMNELIKRELKERKKAHGDRYFYFFFEAVPTT
jgi:hypothetical protein